MVVVAAVAAWGVMTLFLILATMVVFTVLFDQLVRRLPMFQAAERLKRDTIYVGLAILEPRPTLTVPDGFIEQVVDSNGTLLFEDTVDTVDVILAGEPVSTFVDDFAERVQRAYETSPLTWKEFATLVEVTVPTVRAWAAGQRTPTRTNREKMETLLTTLASEDEVNPNCRTITERGEPPEMPDGNVKGTKVDVA